MDCDRCGRTMTEGPLVKVGSRREFQNLCRTCWTQETQNSNSRLISALNELSRAETEKAERARAAARSRAGRKRGGGERGGAALRAQGQEGTRSEDGSPEAGEAMVEEARERRSDPTRPQWHS